MVEKYTNPYQGNQYPCYIQIWHPEKGHPVPIILQ